MKFLTVAILLSVAVFGTEKWNCDLCSFLNNESAPICKICKQGERPQSEEINGRIPIYVPFVSEMEEKYYAMIRFTSGNHTGVGIRTHPEYPGVRTGETISVSESLVQVNPKFTIFEYEGTEIYFYELINGGGWIHDFDAHHHSIHGQYPYLHHRTIEIISQNDLALRENDEKWVCEFCTFANIQSETICQACDGKKFEKNRLFDNEMNQVVESENHFCQNAKENWAKENWDKFCNSMKLPTIKCQSKQDHPAFFPMKQ